MKVKLAWLLLVILAVSPAYSRDANWYILKNIEVKDGDTLKADIIVADFDIALVAKDIRTTYDCWESHYYRRTVDITPEEIKKGLVAADALRKLIKEARNVYIVPKGEGVYNRLVCILYVESKDGKVIDVAKYMSDNGHLRTDNQSSGDQ